jgi:hypothetical protein
MSSTSSEPPAGGSQRPSYGYNVPSMARMPVPGNAEFALYLAVEIIFAIIWAVADSVNTAMWVSVSTALTFGYFISRGIAKAGKVLEQ